MFARVTYVELKKTMRRKSAFFHVNTGLGTNTNYNFIITAQKKIDILPDVRKIDRFHRT